MYNASLNGFGALIEGATSNSSNTRILQNALQAAGYNPGAIDGSFGTNTQKAMHAFQKANGIPVTPYPEVKTLTALDIPYANWPGIVEDAGAPLEQVKIAQRYQVSYTGKPSTAVSTSTPPVEMPIEEGPSAEPMVVTEDGEEVTQAAAAAAAMTPGKWFKKNWPYLAAGAGVGLLGITAAIIATRKRDDESEQLGPEDVDHMAGWGATNHTLLPPRRRGLRGFGRVRVDEKWAQIDVPDAAWAELQRCARGSYQEDLLRGHEAWSGSTLTGKARKWGGRYRASGDALLARLRDVGRRRGLDVKFMTGKHGRRILSIQEAPARGAQATYGRVRPRHRRRGLGGWGAPTPRSVSGWRGFPSRRRSKGLRGLGLTKKEAESEFRDEVLPEVVAMYGRDDSVAKAEAWNDWTDMLRSEGRITRKQYDTWANPF